MTCREKSDWVVGLFFILLGLFFTISSQQQLTIGSLASMDSGFFPFYSGVVLFLIGVGLFVTSMYSIPRKDFPSIPWLPLINLSVVIIAYGIVIAYLGLMIGLIFLVVSSRLFIPNTKWHTTAMVSLASSVVVYILVVLVAPSGLAIWPEMLANIG